MTKQPYQLRVSDWIPIKGPIMYEKRVSHEYNAYSYEDMKKACPQAITRRNVLATYDVSIFIGTIFATMSAAAFALKGIDKLVNLLNK